MISLRSELRRKLLTYFYTNRAARVYVRQLASALGVDSTNLSRELARLEREGLLRSEIEGSATVLQYQLTVPLSESCLFTPSGNDRHCANSGSGLTSRGRHRKGIP